MMKRKLFVIICLGLFIVSCQKSAGPQLPPDKMRAVLFDLHLAETYSMTLYPDSTRRNVERNLDSLAVFYRSVFKHHNITPAEFEQSLKWYMQNPEDLDTIYTRMIPEMGKLEALYD